MIKLEQMYPILDIFFFFFSMIITLFNKNSRFRQLNKKINISSKKVSFSIILFLLSTNLFSQNNNKIPKNNNQTSLIDKLQIDKEHAEKFGYLIVQDKNGRIKPINTLASEIFRKIYKKEIMGNMNANQILISMITFPIQWQYIPVIYVNKKSGLRDRFGQKYLPFIFFFDKDANYIISDDIETAYNKPPVMRTEMDKEIININERLNILYMVFNLSLLNIFPQKNNDKWLSPSPNIISKDSTIRNMMVNYIKQVKLKNWTKSEYHLNIIKKLSTKIWEKYYSI